MLEEKKVIWFFPVCILEQLLYISVQVNWEYKIARIFVGVIAYNYATTNTSQDNGWVEQPIIAEKYLFSLEINAIVLAENLLNHKIFKYFACNN